MSLREHERRILAEIEKQLSEDAPELAGRLEAFGTEDPDVPADPGLQSWRPWVACALIAAVTAGLLVLLFVLTPSAPQPEQPRSTGTSQNSEGTDTVSDPVPEGETVDEPAEPADPVG
ncbi:DUF3040 domain-containing protein [Nocardiopsis sp. NPDC055551]|uniref:DUF3040 domain-containing protein n=1 Tax=Nocardiopsis sp. NPDC006832 TaxID=3157188 RepID=UPI0033CABB2B